MAVVDFFICNLTSYQPYLLQRRDSNRLLCFQSPLFFWMTSQPTTDVDTACQVCGDTSDGLHFGSHSCRACAAFFRRTVTLQLEYICRAKEQCEIQRAARNTCRACRYRKCLVVGMKESAVQLSRDGLNNVKRKSTPPVKPEPSKKPAATPNLEFSTFCSNFNLPLTALPQPVPIFPSAFAIVNEIPGQMLLLPRMHQGYLHFLTVRRATHSLVVTDNIIELFKKNEALRPSKFDRAKRVCQLEAHLVTDIVNTYFQPFSDLPYTEKILLFKNFFCYLSHTDRAYQSYKTFGHDEANSCLLMPDGGYIKSDDLESFYRDAEGVHSTPEEAAKIFRPAMEYILNVIIAHMRKMGITDYEYVALLAFFLWNDACSGISNKTLDVIYKTHDAVLSDLHIHYRQLGLEGGGITRRTGELMLLLPKLTKCVLMLRENSELAELFDIFEADVCCKSFKCE